MKRKFRWMLEGDLPEGKLKPIFVKTNRPFVEQDISHLLHSSIKQFVFAIFPHWQRYFNGVVFFV